MLKNLKRYVMLKIDVDFATGKRAGDISPYDKGLYCDPTWQDLERGVELRLILDDRPVDQYRNIPGVEVIEGLDNCNAAIDEIGRTRYDIAIPELFRLSIIRKGIKIDDIDSSLPPEEQLRILYERGALGIRVIKPRKLS